ncbi:unnamed protein product [Notodromas monacha]|uniref:Uncharacterized protein n=1 Tax=Notodromas monacha TaxID=399045 RepID=A0A7R9GDF7_9CRUS|nr:unnamed protein product [Notodromas monacha]CAG0916880.1 unnamed protein product [Notodromas monacha]
MCSCDTLTHTTGQPVHQHPCQSDCVLLAGDRDHSPHQRESSPSRQIPHLRDGARDSQHMCDCGCPQRAFPLAANAHNGTVGETSLSANSAKASRHEAASLPHG